MIKRRHYLSVNNSAIDRQPGQKHGPSFSHCLSSNGVPGAGQADGVQARLWRGPKTL